jgi:L,D-peptidoglycan transpeptidase YkuD (ErfK/YbiS/YcfS/YnhG family)
VLAVSVGACASNHLSLSARSVPTASVAPTTTLTTPVRARAATSRPATTVATPKVPAELASATGTQAIVVQAGQLTAYERAGMSSPWHRAMGPWRAHVGRAGVAPAGTKREGDGRTPAGTFAFSFFFGVQPDPGVHGEFRRVTGDNIVWDDDPASASYNEWVDTTQQDAGANPEPMNVSPAYDYGVVIGYNTARTPGLGSAIFLHVDTGRPTAGCVSLPQSDLLSVLRWLDPGAHPTIAIVS